MIDAYTDRWALVTGASSGIGAEFARRLAARGMNLLLTALREEQLNELALELHTRHGTQTEVIVCDLSETDSPRTLFEEVSRREIDIELVVNNAGFGHVGQVEEAPLDDLHKMIRLNIEALMDLTYRFLPAMLDRGHGAILNVSSLAAFQPVAYMGVYSSTKAFVLHFSEALWAEVRDRGVTVMAVCPGTTRTDFFDVAGVPAWLQKHSSLSADRVVKVALKAMERRKQFVIPGWRNFLLSMLVRIGSRRTVVRESMKYFRPQKPTTKSDS